MSELTQARLKELLHYDPLTGLFTWKVTNSVRAMAGTVCKAKTSDGYIRIGVDGVRYKAHRLAYLYMLGVFPPKGVDHKNGVRSDNAWENLRPADQKINSHNICSARIDNLTTGVLGVSWRKDIGRYRAYITLDEKQRHLGHFDTVEEAHAAYLLAKNNLHPTHTRLR